MADNETPPEGPIVIDADAWTGGPENEGFFETSFDTNGDPLANRPVALRTSPLDRHQIRLGGLFVALSVLGGVTACLLLVSIPRALARHGPAVASQRALFAVVLLAVSLLAWRGLRSFVDRHLLSEDNAQRRRWRRAGLGKR